MRYIICTCVISLLFGCSQTKSVTSTNFFQKRKYNKGFHYSVTKIVRSSNKKTETVETQNLNKDDITSSDPLNIAEIIEFETTTNCPVESSSSSNLTTSSFQVPTRTVFININKEIKKVSTPRQEINEKNKTNSKSAKSKLWLIGLIAIGFGLILFLIGVSLWTGGLAEILGVGGLIIAGAGFYLLIIGLIVRRVQIKRSKRP